MVESNIIENEYYKIWRENGVIICVYCPGIIIDINIVKKAVEDRILLAEGIARPVYGEGKGVKYWTKEAKDYCFTERGLKDIAALALSSDSQIMKISINWASRFITSKVPLRAFTNRDLAISWLVKYKQEKVAG
jgi:hypothetical protein